MPKPIAPASDRLVRHDYVALEEQLFDVAQAQLEAKIQVHCATNNARRKNGDRDTTIWISSSHHLTRPIQEPGNANMSYNDPAPEADVWSNWLFNARFAHDDEHERVVRLELERIADRVLDGATLESSMSLADVGTGDGLVGFRGIERTGASLKVHFVDVSSAALHHTRQEAIRRNIDSQCSFHEHSAEALTGVSTGSMDAVTTRAVLAYVADKPLAFREFFRILKPGGRISIAEPILRDDALELAALKQLVASLPSGSNERILPFLYRWKSAQLPNTAATIAMSPLTNFGERDLLRFAIEAGFSDIHMELHVDVGPSLVTSWDVLLGSSPHPWAPTLRVILSEHFSSAERQEFEKLFRPLVESRQFLTFNRFAYLTGRRAIK